MNSRELFRHVVILSVAAALCLLIATAAQTAEPVLTTLKLENKSVAEVVNLLAELENASIVVAEEARKKTIDLNVRGLTFTEVLDVLCDASGLQWRRNDNGVYIVGPGGSNRRTTMLAEGAGGNGRDRGKALTRAIIPLQYWDAADISYLFGGRDEPRNPLLKGDSLVPSSLYGIPGVKGITYVPNVGPYQAIAAPTAQEVVSMALERAGQGASEQPKQYVPPTGFPPTAVTPTPGYPPTAGPQYQALGGQLGFLAPEGIEPPIVAYLPLNALIVRGEPEAIEEFRRIIRDYLDVKVPQVLVEVQIISVSLSTIQRYGIHWLWTGRETTMGFLSGTPSAGDLAVGWMRGDIAAQLGASEHADRTKVMQALRVVAFNNFPGTIQYTTTFTGIVQSGVVQPGIAGGQVVTSTMPVIIPVVSSLNVTPRINGDGTITLFALPVLADVSGTTPLPGGGVIPNVESRSVAALARVKDGETVVIGGLTSRNVTKTRWKVPLLSSIPFLGKLLFTETDQGVADNEVFIFLTPRIVPEEAPGAPTAVIAP
jgi:type II secretory pathway component GspD/PulD (secretin)